MENSIASIQISDWHPKRDRSFEHCKGIKVLLRALIQPLNISLTRHKQNLSIFDVK
jgi:hypothetical protein